MVKLKDVDIFLNDNFQVLMIIYNHSQNINGHVFTAITQQEIGDSLGFSIMKVNPIIQKLKKAGYINSYNNSRGRYVLTEKAYSLIKDITDLKGEN